MNTPVNPYIAGAPLRGERGFFGRQDTLEWVERELRNLQTNALVLFGQRRIGKTTLLLQLARNLSRDDFIPIYFDLQDQASRPLGKTLCDIADILTEKAGVDLGETGPFDDQGRYFQKEFLPRFYEAIGEKRRPVFLLDEFDVLDQSAEAALVETATAKALFPLLRRLMTTDGHTAFVFVVGRRAEDLSIDFNATFKASLVREIWVLDNGSAESLVRQAEANGTLKFTGKAVQRVLSLTNYHPYLTQLLCQRVWELAYAAGPSSVPTVDEAQVDIALESSLEAGNQALDWLWNGLNPAEKIYASALAEIAGENETIPEERIIEVLATHAARLRTREIELAPRDLVKRHVLDTSGERGYRFAVELFRRWVHKNKPLVVVKDEVDRINPMADQMFVFGDGFYDARNWEKAAYYFREALEVNPRHFRARLYLGETLLEQGKVDEAITELDQALVLDREESRLPLARAWLAKAEQLKPAGDLDAVMKAYDKVLELSPRESLAIQGRTAVWAQRAQQAEAAGDLEAAIEACRQAGDTANLDRLNRVVRERLLVDLQDEAQEYEKSGLWDSATQVFTRMVELAPDDDRRQALKREVERVAILAEEQQAKARLETLELLKTQAQDHEQRGDWDGAVQVYEQLGEMAEEESWQGPLEKARREQELSAIFEQGRQAMQNEDWKDAQALFARLIQARPDYNRDGLYAAALLQDAIQHRKRPVRRPLPLPGRSFSHLSAKQKLGVRFALGVFGLLILAGAIQGGMYLYNYYKPALKVGDVKSGVSLSDEAITLASVGALESSDVWYFEDSVNNVAVSPDGGTLAVVFKAYDKSLSDYTALIDRETGTVRQILEGHSNNVSGVDFSPDGSLLATGSWDSSIKLWEVSEGRIFSTLAGHSDWVNSVDISPDGLLLASGSDDDTIRIWQVEDGSLLHTLEGHDDNVLKVAFSPDNSLLASVSFDDTVRIWRVEDGSLIRTLEGHTADIRSVAFSPDGLLVASAAEDGTVIVWQVEDGSQAQTLTINEPGSIVFDVDFSPDGEMLAVASGDSSGIWQVADGELLSSAGEYLYQAAFSPDGRFLAAAESGTVRFLTVDEAKLAELPTPTAEPTEVPVEEFSAAEFGRCGNRARLSREISLHSYEFEIDPATLQTFEEECGVTVNHVFIESEDELLTSLQEGEAAHDVMLVSYLFTDDLIDEGLLYELDYDVIPNIEDMEPIHLNQFFDPGQQYSVPYAWSAYGFAVDTAQVEEYQPSWSMLLDPNSPYCSRISLGTGRRNTMGAALMYLGYSLNETDPAHIEEAYKLLSDLSDCVQYNNNTETVDSIVSGERAIVHLWSGLARTLADPDEGGREEIVFVLPEEGVSGWQDNLVLAAGTTNPYTSMVLINFLSEPEFSAQNAGYTGYSTPSIPAREFVDPDLLANPGFYPRAEVLEKVQWIDLDLGDAVDLYDSYWAELTGQQ